MCIGETFMGIGETFMCIGETFMCIGETFKIDVHFNVKLIKFGLQSHGRTLN